MTKMIRVENADMSNYKVLVEVWDKGYPAGEPDRLSQTIELNSPTALATTHITNTRYLVVKEAPQITT